MANYMKKIFLLGAVVYTIGMMAACKGGTAEGASADGTQDSILERERSYADSSIQRETEDIYVDGTQTEYVLYFHSEGCVDRMLHDVENDSVALDNFYIAEDDLAYYLYECREKLRAMGVRFYEADADISVFCQDDMSFQPIDSCACGVLIVKPGCRFAFLDLMEFLFGHEDSGE